MNNNKNTKLFLRGPIYLETLTPASSLGGKSLNVYLALFFQAYLKGTTTVPLPKRAYQLFGLNRFSMYRGLKNLEQSGLVKVVRNPGQSPRVTLLQLDKRILVHLKRSNV